jgi:hypothetical protein
LAYSPKLTLSARMVRTQMLMPAAPTPWRARPNRSKGKPLLVVVVGAAVHSAEPSVMMARAVCRVAWRPKTSASWAKKGRKDAEVRLKAVMIQFSCLSSSVFWGGCC